MPAHRIFVSRAILSIRRYSSATVSTVNPTAIQWLCVVVMCQK
jgi:hypothetical protein